MAEVILNPAISELDDTSLLYELYTRFYDGMIKANSVDSPEYLSNPPYKEDESGALVVDQEAINEQLREYSKTLTKNSAYMFANAIVSTIAPNSGMSGGTTGTGFLVRSGDSMQGMLGALHGFEAGYANQKILETIINAENEAVAVVSGSLQVSGATNIKGSLNLDGNGLLFNNHKSVWYDNNTLHITGRAINLSGDVSLDSSISIGNLVLDGNGVRFGNNDYYHSGNSNKSDVDWTMKNAIVKSSVEVGADARIDGKLSVNSGLSVSLFGRQLVRSEGKDSSTAQLAFGVDLSIDSGYGIKIGNSHIIRSVDSDNAVSFTAPGAVLKLGDKSTESGASTKYISLQSDIKNYSGAFTIISNDGSGNFPNGFSVGAANALGDTFSTYYAAKDDYGVVAKHRMRFGGSSGAYLYGDAGSLLLNTSFMDGNKRVESAFSMQPAKSTSALFNQSGGELALVLQTSSKHFSFGAPVEATCYAIKSERYKTRLEEDVLFFDDGKFIEGVENGLRLSGNSMFDGNLYSFNPGSSSVSFSSGFAGKGWAIVEDAKVGGTHATFDSLTIRKKMRVYELEVQKSSATNGSLWVSDSCSGDEVRVLN